MPGSTFSYKNLIVGQTGELHIKDYGDRLEVEASIEQLQELKEKELNLAELLSQNQTHLTTLTGETATIEGKVHIKITDHTVILKLRERMTLSAFGLPSSNPNFIARPEIEKQLQKKLKEDDQQPIILAACQGLGGVGKTQLAQHYLLNSGEQYTFRGWIQADTTEQLVVQYQQLAHQLKLVDSKVSAEEVISVVKNWFNQKTQWLLVYDNAQDYNALQAYLPSQGGRILITTRNANWIIPGSIFIDVMCEAEAVELLQKTSGRCDPEMIELAKELGYLPLALAQAGAYIGQKKKTTKQYLELYLKRKSRLLADDKAFPAGCKHEPVYITWDMNIAEIQQKCPNALKVINVCVWLAPTNIPWPLLVRCLEIEDETDAELEFDDIKQALGNYSLCTIHEEKQTLSMHHLVQTVRRDKLTIKEQEAGIEHTTNKLLAEFPSETNEKLDAYKRLLLPHLEVILFHTLELSPHEEIDLFLELYLLSHLLGRIYLYLICDPNRAKKLLETVLDISIELFGKEHPNVANALNDVANAYGDLGDAQKKKEFLESALIIKEKHYGSNHPEVADTLGDLANAYGELGDALKRRKLIERVLVSQKSYHGSNHPVVANSLVNLANTYGELGDAQEKKKLIEQALIIEEKHYGSNHPHIAKTLVSLSTAYDALGDVKGQKKLLERALPIFEKNYGLNHPHIARTLVNLAIAYGGLGNAQEMKKLLERALSIVEKHYGPNHPEVAVVLLNLANAYGTLGNAQEMKKLLKRVLIIKEKLYGSNHPEIARVLSSLGAAYNTLGDMQKQKKLLERALAIQESYYNPNHPDIAKTLVNLANAYGVLGHIQEMKKLLERALSIKESYYSLNHPEVATVLVNLAVAYGNSGKVQEMKTFLERALAIQEPYYGPNHPVVAKTLANLAIACGGLGDAQEMKKLLERTLPIFENYYGPNHLEVARALTNLAHAYGTLGNAQEAKDILERTLLIFEKHYGINHPDVVKILMALATAYSQLNKPQEAVYSIERAYNIIKNYPGHGSDHPLVRQIMEMQKAISSSSSASATSNLNKYNKLSFDTAYQVANPILNQITLNIINDNLLQQFTSYRRFEAYFRKDDKYILDATLKLLNKKLAQEIQQTLAVYNIQSRWVEDANNSYIIIDDINGEQAFKVKKAYEKLVYESKRDFALG
jgi:tetratricopeptide (TPR) repeat protein